MLEEGAHEGDPSGEDDDDEDTTYDASHGRPLPRKTKFIRKRYLHMGVEAGLTGQSPGLLPVDVL